MDQRRTAGLVGGTGVRGQPPARPGAAPSPSIDLNADLGEAPWGQSSDEGLLAIVSSANVACGGHAGDAATMRAVCATAARRGVSVGAHVSYADREGFGRRPMTPDPADLQALVLAQLQTLDAIAVAAGSPITYCKPHGALYNTIAHDAEQATAVARACTSYRPGLAVLGLPGSVWLRIAEQHGLRPVGEAFADRAYAADGTLMPRTETGSVLHDVQAIADRVAAMVATGTVIAATGETIPLPVGSVCVHGDTPGALAIAGAVRRRLEGDGVRIASFAAARDG